MQIKRRKRRKKERDLKQKLKKFIFLHTISNFSPKSEGVAYLIRSILNEVSPIGNLVLRTETVFLNF